MEGPGWSQTYLFSPNPAVVESHEFRKPLLIEVEQQHQVQAGIHQLILQLHWKRKFLSSSIKYSWRVTRPRGDKKWDKSPAGGLVVEH